jgi:Asp/Glu/hydantoin racemase
MGCPERWADVNAMNLENVLRDIQTDRAHLVHGSLLSCGSDDTALLAHRDAGGGAIHGITSRLERARKALQKKRRPVVQVDGNGSPQLD